MLLTLTVEQAEVLPYPIGCPVWYSFAHGPQNEDDKCDDNDPFPNSQILKHGVVKSVALDLLSEDKGTVYTIAHFTADGSVDYDGESDVVPEHELAYGFHCPVYVVPTDARGDDDTSCLEGKILLAEPAEKGNGSEKQRYLYTIMFYHRDRPGFGWFEGGIPSERVKYRKIELPPPPASEIYYENGDRGLENEGPPIKHPVSICTEDQQRRYHQQQNSGSSENFRKHDNNIGPSGRNGCNNVSPSTGYPPVASVQSPGDDPSIPSSITCEKSVHR